MTSMTAAVALLLTTGVLLVGPRRALREVRARRPVGLGRVGAAALLGTLLAVLPFAGDVVRFMSEINE